MTDHELLGLFVVAGAFLAAGIACGPRPSPPAPAVVVVRASELTDRVERGRVRPLQPPAAPDTTTTVAARPVPQRTVRPPARPVLAPSADRWARLRQCESGGNYAENTGNGFFGAYQTDRGTWAGYGGYRIASDAPALVQDQWAQALYARRGAQPWPNCGRWLR